jgi:hypothetical protein
MESVRVPWIGFCPPVETAFSAVSFHFSTSLAAASGVKAVARRQMARMPGRMAPLGSKRLLCMGQSSSVCWDTVALIMGEPPRDGGPVTFP